MYIAVIGYLLSKMAYFSHGVCNLTSEKPFSEQENGGEEV